MQEDRVSRGDVEVLVDTFPGQSIDFFGALRARVYDDKVSQLCVMFESAVCTMTRWGVPWCLALLLHADQGVQAACQLQAAAVSPHGVLDPLQIGHQQSRCRSWVGRLHMR